MNLSLYYHTLRYVPVRQSVQRVWYKLHRPRPDLRPAPPLRSSSGSKWIRLPLRPPLMLSPTRFRLLNEEFEVRTAEDWFSPERKFLWNYNLHYFEDLFAEDAEARREWHKELIERWIAENPPGPGIGWDPYPMSLRICNWIKWVLAGNELSENARHSLAIQVRYLRKRHDRHLLGNHLLVNGKAFIFAGLFHDGREAEEWYKKGMAILREQMPEQFLPDGGHFERSPMYHNLMTEDFLDLLNILRIYGRKEEFAWHEELGRMRNWARALSHPDGQIALFNDAAFGIAPAAAELMDYAEKLGLSPAKFDPQEDAALHASGYFRAVRGPAVLFIDAGPVGPDYLPGHGHADTLSFELSLQGRRVVVDSGTSIYEIGAERLRQRGTGAHNTLQVDGQNSSEVWASFRIARRARIVDFQMAPPIPQTSGERPPHFRIEAAHDGYTRLRGGGVHRRHWTLNESELHIQDVIEGSGEHEIRIAFHLHPDWQAAPGESGGIEISLREPPPFPALPMILKLDPNLTCQITSSTYHPEFGLSIPNQKIMGSYRGKLPVNFASRLLWA